MSRARRAMRDQGVSGLRLLQGNRPRATLNRLVIIEEIDEAGRPTVKAGGQCKNDAAVIRLLESVLQCVKEKANGRLTLPAGLPPEIAANVQQALVSE